MCLIKYGKPQYDIQVLYKSTALSEALMMQKFNNHYLFLKYLTFVSQCFSVLILKADVPGHIMLKAIRR